MERKITCEDGNDNILKTQIIPFTDFKDTEVIFWFENETLFLRTIKQPKKSKQ
jgi:hypothetical protein